MASGFVIEEGKWGPKLVVIGKWSPSIQRYATAERIRELELNHGKGWERGELSFLADLPFLGSFSVTDLVINDISPIHHLTSLKSLTVYTYCKTEIDFTKFPRLEECVLEWRPRAKSLFQCKTLKRLFLNSYKGKDTDGFAGLPNLEWLEVGNGPVQSLKGLGTLKKLKHLQIFLMRKLESLEGLEGLSALEDLEVSGCRKIQSIEPLTSLSKLRRLQVGNCGDIETIRPVEKLKRLEFFWFYDTNVLDGDLSPLLKLKHLTDINFKNSKRYEYTREEMRRLLSEG